MNNEEFINKVKIKLYEEKNLILYKDMFKSIFNNYFQYNFDYNRYIEQIIITDNFNKACNDINYINNNRYFSEYTHGTTIQVDDEKYIIMLKLYSLIYTDGYEIFLKPYSKHFIVHELAHVEWNIKFSEEFKSLSQSTAVSHDLASIFIKEFFAEIQAQSQVPIEAPSIELTLKKLSDEFIDLKQSINVLNNNILGGLNCVLKTQIKELINRIVFLSKDIIYNLALLEGMQYSNKVLDNQVEIKLNVIKSIELNGELKELLLEIEKIVNDNLESPKKLFIDLPKVSSNVQDKLISFIKYETYTC